MSQSTYTRRDLLKTGAGAAGAAALAGCGDIMGGNGNGGSGSDPVQEVVPEQAQMVAHMDIQGMVQDSNLRSIGNSFLGELATMEGYTGPETIEEAIAQAEEQAQEESGDSELGSDSIESMTFFTEVENVDNQDPYAGAAITTSLSEDEFTSIIDEQGTEYSTEDYNGVTIYKGTNVDMQQAEDGGVAWLGDGQMAAGTREVLEDMIDVFNGDADGLSGDIKGHYDGVSEGYLRFATMVPEGTFPENQGEGGIGPNWEPFQNIEFISGNFVSGGDTVSLNINHHTDSSDSASAVQQEVDNLLGTLGMAFGQNELASNLLDAVSAETDGSTVITSFEDDIESLEEYAAEAASFLMSGGAGMGAGV